MNELIYLVNGVEYHSLEQAMQTAIAKHTSYVVTVKPIKENIYVETEQHEQRKVVRV